MNGSDDGDNCALMSWGMAAFAAFLAFVLLLVLGDWRVIQAIFAAGVILIGVGLGMSWLFCTPLPGPVVTSGTAAPKPDTAPAPASAEATEPEPAPQHAAPAEATEPLVRTGVQLSGEEELASRKGSWTYSPESADGDPEGVKPALLQEAPADGGDDLQQIKGIGPKLAELCNRLGIYRFSQIAAWSEAEVAWVDSNLEGFKGRVSRDNWVEQAKALSSNGAG